MPPVSDTSTVARLYGLVLAGGESRRMHEDKAALDYHGVPQALYAADLLSFICKPVYISAREGDTAHGYPVIVDRFAALGPMGGVLSAMLVRPEAAWLVLACDLPLVDEIVLQELVSGRDATKDATVFEHDGLYEPCCAIYEPKLADTLKRQVAEGNYSLHRTLESRSVCQLRPTNGDRLLNVNTPADRDAAIARLANKVLQ